MTSRTEQIQAYISTDQIFDSQFISFPCWFSTTTILNRNKFDMGGVGSQDRFWDLLCHPLFTTTKYPNRPHSSC